MSVLDTMAHCVSWSPDGELLAVGLGYKPGGFGPGAKRQRKDGAFLILQRSDLTIVQEARDSKQLISSIKWSPDGGTLAVTSYDRAIYLYNVGAACHLNHRCACMGLQPAPHALSEPSSSHAPSWSRAVLR